MVRPPSSGSAGYSRPKRTRPKHNRICPNGQRHQAQVSLTGCPCGCDGHHPVGPQRASRAAPATPSYGTRGGAVQCVGESYPVSTERTPLQESRRRLPNLRAVCRYFGAREQAGAGALVGAPIPFRIATMARGWRACSGDGVSPAEWAVRQSATAAVHCDVRLQRRAEPRPLFACLDGHHYQCVRAHRSPR